VRMAEYRSIEKKLIEDTGVKDFLEMAGRVYYGTVATIFRVPTFVRKFCNDQLINNEWMEAETRNQPLKNRSRFYGGLSGLCAGVISDLLLGGYAIIGAVINNENYTPLAILGITNLASLIFEAGRYGQSRIEYKESKRK